VCSDTGRTPRPAARTHLPVKDVVVEKWTWALIRAISTLFLPLLVQIPYKEKPEAPCPECGHKAGLMPHRRLDVTGGADVPQLGAVAPPPPIRAK